MTAVYFNSSWSDDERREHLYRGDLFAYAASDSTRMLCEFARELSEEAFAPHDPREAQYHLPQEKYVEILAELAGPTYKVGSVLKFMDEEADSGLRQYLVPWSPDDAAEVDTEAAHNQKILEAARDTFLAAGLRTRISSTPGNMRTIG